MLGVELGSGGPGCLAKDWCVWHSLEKAMHSGRLECLGLRLVCQPQEPTSQAPKSGG